MEKCLRHGHAYHELLTYLFILSWKKQITFFLIIGVTWSVLSDWLIPAADGTQSVNMLRSGGILTVGMCKQKTLYYYHTHSALDTLSILVVVTCVFIH